MEGYGRWTIQHPTGVHMRTSRDIVLDLQSIHNPPIITNGHNSYDEVTITEETDQIAAQNLIFMASDGQEIDAEVDENGTLVVSASGDMDDDCKAAIHQVIGITNECIQNQEEDQGGGSEPYTMHYADDTPQLIQEEIITEDWVQPQGEECVEISADQISSSNSQMLIDLEVPLPTVQDEYTALRPYPCDFCSRRFRKKTTLMNHMVTHQNDRPNMCKLCGLRFMKRCELLRHLQIHANEPEDPVYNEADYIDFDPQDEEEVKTTDRPNDHYYDHGWTVHDEKFINPASKTTRYQNPSGNSSSTSTSTIAAARVGRVSRLTPRGNKNHAAAMVEKVEKIETDTGENYTVNHNPNEISTLQHQPNGVQKFPVMDDTKPFVCQECGLSFAREKAYLSHIKSHRNDSPYECRQCNEVFWDTPSLLDHQKAHKFEESNSEYEPEQEADNDSGSDHLYGEFYCKECGVSFHRQDLLSRHARTHRVRSTTLADSEPSPKDAHSCTTCGETFASALALLAHAEVHARCSPYKCIFCGETFFEEIKIKAHMQAHHASDMTDTSCSVCGKQCRDHKALLKHSWDHSREKCHSCSKCGKFFYNKARLKRHMASHRNKSVICNICHEEFPDGRTLSNHRHSHSATSAGKLFPCNQCGKTFGSRSSQQIHVRIHTGERPYGCRFCWKAFADGGTLRKHERIHTGEKPYGCSVCPRAFNQRVVLREHIRSHHSGMCPKRGTFFCTLCSLDFGSSNELIQHLIQHSDMKTAQERQPVTGPRKYKRRRKLKPHEIARMKNAAGNAEGSDLDLSDFEVDNVGVNNFLGIMAENNGAQIVKKEKSEKLDENVKNVVCTEGLPRSDVIPDNECTVISDEEDNQLSEEDNTNNARNDDNYKFLFNLESIDSLVVGPKEACKRQESGSHVTETAQRTKQVHLVKVDPPTSIAKRSPKPERNSKASRPRMIHTEKWLVAHPESGKKKSRTFIKRTDPVNMDLLPNKSRSSLADDYDIISPAIQLPNQISSSPRNTHADSQAFPPSRRPMQTPHSQINIYDSPLLEAAALRKDAYEKFNPNIVHDLEEILRSPDKRQRYTSESSSQYLAEQSEEEQNLVKIEPTSPDLREIVASCNDAVGDSGVGGYGKRNSVRSTRSRVVTPNRRYLNFEIDVSNMLQMPFTSTTRKRSTSISSAAKTAVRSKNATAPPSPALQTYLNYTTHTFNHVPSLPDTVSVHNTQKVGDSSTERRAKRYFECEMCSETFSDRAQLLDHVPVHI